MHTHTHTLSLCKCTHKFKTQPNWDWHQPWNWHTDQYCAVTVTHAYIWDMLINFLCIWVRSCKNICKQFNVSEFSLVHWSAMQDCVLKLLWFIQIIDNTVLGQSSVTCRIYIFFYLYNNKLGEKITAQRHVNLFRFVFKRLMQYPDYFIIWLLFNFWSHDWRKQRWEGDSSDGMNQRVCLKAK